MKKNKKTPKKNKNEKNISFTLDKALIEKFKTACKGLKITQKSVIETAINKTIREDNKRNSAIMLNEYKKIQAEQIRLSEEDKQRLSDEDKQRLKSFEDIEEIESISSTEIY